MLQADWKMHMNEGETVLYNLSNNPDEDVNVAGEYKEIFDKLKKNMDDWNKTLPNKDAATAVVMPPADLPAT